MQNYSTFQKKVTLAHELLVSPDYNLSLFGNNIDQLRMTLLRSRNLLVFFKENQHYCIKNIVKF